MRKDQVLSLTALAAVLVALLANHSIARIEPTTPHRLPVETFPRQFAGWRAGPDLPVDPSVQQTLSTAKIVERSYTGPSGESMDVTLVSAEQVADIHDPKVCFPAQGWTLSHERLIPIGAEYGDLMTATLGTRQLDVLFWLTAKTPQPHPVSPLLMTLRRHLGGAEDRIEGQSLLVRLMTPHTPTSRPLLEQFLTDVQPPLGKLEHRS